MSIGGNEDNNQGVIWIGLTETEFLQCHRVNSAYHFSSVTQQVTKFSAKHEEKYHIRAIGMHYCIVTPASTN